MEEPDIKRKLATILVADIVGYSRLTANDEDWTIRALGDFRKIVDDIIARHDGRIFSTGGDSVLAEFASPVEAVRCAVDFQEASRSRNLLQPRDKQLRYRIGINLGDVMVRGNDLLGDGVNVAARLEGIAEPGGICVSATVWDQINGKLSIGYVDIGEQSVKNIPRPVRAYHLRVDGSVGEAAVEPARPQAVPAQVGPVQTSPGAADGSKGSPMAAILGGAAAVIVILAALLVWQMWPKPASGPTASAPIAPSTNGAGTAPSTPLTIPPATAQLPFKDALAAKLLALLPARSDASRAEAINAYLGASGHKALAISQEPPGIWRATHRSTADNAEQSALEECQVVHGHPCRVVAVDDQLSSQPNPARDMPNARYSGDFDPGKIPGLHAEDRNRPDIAGYAKAPGPKAAAYNADAARIFTATGAASQRAAEEQALKQCASEASNEKLAAPCMLYASDNRVVLPLRLKEPMTATATAPTPVAAVPPVPALQPEPAKPATGSVSPKTFRDCPNCPEMVVIPAGSFQMGAAPGENERYQVPATEAGRDEPEHSVTFAKPFALGKFDVTRAEFAAFARATNFRGRPGCQTVTNGVWTPQPQASWEDPGFPQKDNDPVVCMNEIEIGAYLFWLRQQTGKDYRLPSEAEWEYAERAGTSTAFYWGNEPKDACAYENVGDESYGGKFSVKATVPCNDGFAELAPAGSFKPNPFGLYDMAGNIFVAMADCWNETYSGAPSDGSAWRTGDCMRHVERKAAFGNAHAAMFRSANRQAEGNLVKRNRFGFRVALSLP